MARMLIPVTAVLVFALAARADSKDKELDRLRGKWTVERIEENGVAEPDEEARKFLLTFQTTRIVVEMDGRQEFTEIQIDPDQQPKHIDMTPQYGADKGKTFRGIYVLEGDTLRICAKPSGNRPKEIISEQGVLLMVLKRKKG